MKTSRILLVLAALAASGAARAADGHFGLQATLAMPQGDLGDKDFLDGQMGIGLGASFQIPLSNGQAITPRLDYTTYRKTRDVVSNGLTVGLENKATLIALGADYQYFTGGKVNSGFYLLGGLGYVSGKFEITASAMGLSLGTSATKGTAYLQIGGGYQFTRNMGAELRYQSAKFTDVESTIGTQTVKGDISAPSFQASFTYRF